LLGNSHKNLLILWADRTYIGHTGAFYFDNDNISAKDMKLFLLKQTYKSLFFFLRLWVFPVLLAVPSKPTGLAAVNPLMASG